MARSAQPDFKAPALTAIRSGCALGLSKEVARQDFSLLVGPILGRLELGRTLGTTAAQSVDVLNSARSRGASPTTGPEPTNTARRAPQRTTGLHM